MRKLLLTLLTGLLLFAGLVVLCITQLAGAKTTTPPITTFQQDAPPRQSDTFSVLTLNMAHGRGNSSHQLFLTTPEIRENLDRIIALLKRTAPDIVALQEADGPSFWSGRFNHVAYIGRKAGFSHAIQAAHVEGFGLSYGTALMTKQVLTAPLAVTFSATPPTLSKGFILTTVRLGTGLTVDLVSLHLDFFRSGNRKKQVTELLHTLQKRKNPLIIMGDFNSPWGKNTAPERVRRTLDLSVYKPDNSGMDTFPALGERIDFIMVSNHFEILSHTILSDVVSDHRGVLVKLRIKSQD